MKRLPHVAMLLVAVALVAADKGEKKKGDAETIQGKWAIVETYYRGKNNGQDHVGDVITFSGKKMLGPRDFKDRSIEVTFELRPDKKPRQLDMTVTVDGEVTTTKAIYELSGDTLKYCFMEPTNVRPDAIGTAADDERWLFVLKRVKDDGEKKP